MKSDKRIILFHLGIVLVIGILLATFLGFDGKPDPESQARALVPDDLVAGKMIIGHFGGNGGAAIFKIKSPIPDPMQSFELKQTYRLGRTPSKSISKVSWTNSGRYRTYQHASFRDCSCFACAKDAKICEKASDWLDEQGSSFYISADHDGTSYLMNHDLREIIVVWNHPI